jgi:hypothetical protein
LDDLAAMTQLEELSLYGTRITDDGIQKLKTLKNLRRLKINQSRVTSDGVRRLQKELPNCAIIY